MRPQSHLRQTSPTGCCSSTFLKVQGARVKDLGSRNLSTVKDNELVNLLVFEIGRWFDYSFCFGDRWSVCLHKVLAHDLSCKVSLLNYLYLSLTRLRGASTGTSRIALLVAASSAMRSFLGSCHRCMYTYACIWHMHTYLVHLRYTFIQSYTTA